MATMNRARQLSALVAVGIAALTLTACTPEAAPAPSSSPTTSAEPSPSASAPAEGTKPGITDLILTTEGLGSGGPGDLVFGETPSSDSPATDLVTLNPTACPDRPDPALWLANYPETDYGFGPDRPFAIALTDNKLTRIDIRDVNIITDEGLAIGSSLDAVLGTYPGGPDEVYNHADVSDVYVFMGTKGKLMFEVAVDRIPGYWDATDLNTVVFLSAVSIDTAAYGVAASDNGIGYCDVA